MGKRRIRMEKIEDRNRRNVCFSKRRAGLFKKAAELCRLTNAKIAILVLSAAGNPFVFGDPSLLVNLVPNAAIDDVKHDSDDGTSDGILSLLPETDEFQSEPLQVLEPPANWIPTQVLETPATRVPTQVLETPTTWVPTQVIETPASWVPTQVLETPETWFPLQVLETPATWVPTQVLETPATSLLDIPETHSEEYNNDEEDIFSELSMLNDYIIQLDDEF